MSNLLNLNAEIGADIIGDDAQPTLTFRNISTGAGAKVEGLACVSNASIDYAMMPKALVGTATVITGTAGVVPLTVGRTAAGNYSTGVLKLAGQSVASGCVIELTGTAFVSCSTIKFITGGVAGTGAFRVKLTDGDTLGWIPILPDAALTAAAWA